MSISVQKTPDGSMPDPDSSILVISDKAKASRSHFCLTNSDGEQFVKISTLDDCNFKVKKNAVSIKHIFLLVFGIFTALAEYIYTRSNYVLIEMDDGSSVYLKASDLTKQFKTTDVEKIKKIFENCNDINAQFSKLINEKIEVEDEQVSIGDINQIQEAFNKAVLKGISKAKVLLDDGSMLIAGIDVHKKLTIIKLFSFTKDGEKDIAKDKDNIIGSGANGQIRKIYEVTKNRFSIIKTLNAGQGSFYYPELIDGPVDPTALKSNAEILKLKHQFYLLSVHKGTEEEHGLQPAPVLFIEEISTEQDQNITGIVQKKYDIVLDKWLSQKDISLKTRIECSKKLMLAVKNMFNKNITHGDLKPSNIFFDNNIIHIGDLETGRHFIGEKTVVRPLVDSYTPEFSSPVDLEQINQFRKFNHIVREKEAAEKADLFSAGVSIYNILTKGLFPYDFNTDRGSDKRFEGDDQINPIFNKLDLQMALTGCYEESKIEEIISTIEKMVKVDPKDRISIKDAFSFWESLSLPTAA